MRSLSAAVAVALMSLTAACGGGEADQSAQTAPTTQQPTSESSSTEASASESASESASASESGASEDTQVLTGVVGQEGDPDAFVITLTDGSGNEVTTLPAGEYEIQVNDLSTIHNFHLTGPGVEETTAVPETGEVTWTVTLEPGEYTFRCDPHPPMVGNFTVS
jgi:plastocyanin